MVSPGEITDTMIRGFLLALSFLLVALAVVVLLVDVLAAPAEGKQKAEANHPAPGPTSPRVGPRWPDRTGARRSDAVRPSPDGSTRADRPAP
jgi:hypothetical protein